MKTKISSQSKKNFVLEKDVRYLDSRIALLIQNRMALEEVRHPPPFGARCGVPGQATAPSSSSTENKRMAR